MARRKSSGINSLRFNQDQGCFTCCLTTGLRVYNVDPLVEKTHYSADEVGAVTLCEMVQRSNWLLVVRARRPRSLLLLDDQSRQFRAEVAFSEPVRALRARVDKVAVVLTSSIHVLSLPTLRRAALLRIPAGGRPLCDLATAPHAPAHLLAAPAHRKGALQLLDVTRAVKGGQSSSPAVLNCHKGVLVCMSLSALGTRLATASERGTLVRVWDTGAKTLLHELRRGSDYADVYCISFNPSGSLLCLVSDKGTLHVWSCARAPAHLAAAPAPPATRALCAFADDSTTTVICEDGTFHKFTYSAEGTCLRSDFEYFLQVGDDDEFIQ
ncbi:hypothetical protein JYU34_010084 [Plutella xylostella]|uniref:WD repeat domain phosphoinositide-interacting protein 4 n=1 Tax=Plutella xylostella TaxID=51655 RepID=A0ABQ7QLC1_PLUXY|nr:WD repeat domain phosphoinositide-interacting protein 4 [Plutella xylostella]KAG7304733.1 hypothetical protein JYU34_010084 [Plutella xylostella]